MERIFKNNVKEYVSEIDAVLNYCAEHKSFDTLAKKTISIVVNGKKVDILPQHALYNSIVESYLPRDLDMQSNKLYYFGDFSKGSIEEYIQKMHTAIKAYSERVTGKWHPMIYFEDIDAFNMENKECFDSGNLKYEKWSDLWQGLVDVEPDKDKANALNAKEIYGIIMQNIQFSFTMYSYIFDERVLCVFDGLETFEAVCRVDERAAKIIKTSVFDNSDSIFETLRKRNEAGKYLINVITKHKIEPLNTMIQASSVREEQFIDMVVGLGIKPFINDAGSQITPSKHKLTRPYGSFVYNKTLHASYLRGLHYKEDHYCSISSAVTSMIISKSKIEDIADLNKKLTLASKRMVVNPDRNYKCGTKHFRKYTVRKQSDLDRIKGMYEQVGAKSIKIDHTNLNKYLGREIRLRTPALCNSALEGGVCRYCLGDHIYDLNDKFAFRNREYKSNIATLWVNIVGPQAQQALLSAKHNASPNPLTPTYHVINENGTHNYNMTQHGNKIEFVYSHEDRVFINLNGVPIVPEYMVLIQPEKMYMPWTNKQKAFFSKRVGFIVDGLEYTVESDTYFFMYEQDMDPGVREYSLRHLYENIGITSLFYKLQDATDFGVKTNPDRYDIQKYFDLLESINPKEHLTFFHVLFADFIRLKNDNAKLIDYSIEDLDFEVIAIDVALQRGSNLTNTFAAGYFILNATNPKNFGIEDKLYVDTDHLI